MRVFQWLTERTAKAGVHLALGVARIGEDGKSLRRLQLRRLGFEVRGVAFEIDDGLSVDEAVSETTGFLGFDAERPNLFERHLVGHGGKTHKPTLGSWRSFTDLALPTPNSKALA